LRFSRHRIFHAGIRRAAGQAHYDGGWGNTPESTPPASRRSTPPSSHRGATPPNGGAASTPPESYRSGMMRTNGSGSFRGHLGTRSTLGNTVYGGGGGGGDDISYRAGVAKGSPRLDGPVSFERAARTGHSRLLFTAATRQVQPDQEANSTAYRNRILRNIAAHSGDRAAAGVIGSPPLSRSATALDSEYFDRSVIGKGTEHRHAAAARAEAMASYAVLRNVSAQPNIPRSAQQTIMATQAATTAALSA
jgi:hypothetical protein